MSAQTRQVVLITALRDVLEPFAKDMAERYGFTASLDVEILPPPVDRYGVDYVLRVRVRPKA